MSGHGQCTSAAMCDVGEKALVCARNIQATLHNSTIFARCKHVEHNRRGRHVSARPPTISGFPWGCEKTCAVWSGRLFGDLALAVQFIGVHVNIRAGDCSALTSQRSAIQIRQSCQRRSEGQ